MDDSYLNDLPLWADDETRAVLIKICRQHGVPVDVIDELLTLQRKRQHQERAHGINLRIEEVLGRIE